MRNRKLARPCENPTCGKPHHRYRFCSDQCRRSTDNANRPGHGNRREERDARAKQEALPLFQEQADTRTWAERREAIRRKHGVKFDEKTSVRMEMI